MSSEQPPNDARGASGSGTSSCRASGTDAPTTARPSLTVRLPLRIPASHPALPGHFPGHPLVPGVLLLDAVLEAAQHWLRTPLQLRTLTQAKFIAPLLPDQDAQIELRRQGNDLRFSVTRGATTLAQGLMQVQDGTGP